MLATVNAFVMCIDAHQCYSDSGTTIDGLDHIQHTDGIETNEDININTSFLWGLPGTGFSHTRSCWFLLQQIICKSPQHQNRSIYNTKHYNKIFVLFGHKQHTSCLKLLSIDVIKNIFSYLSVYDESDLIPLLLMVRDDETCPLDDAFLRDRFNTKALYIKLGVVCHIEHWKITFDQESGSGVVADEASGRAVQRGVDWLSSYQNTNS
jgi:hypothetical protein